MAGAGYKLFNTGDVLTAAQVNTYLMEQSVMVFDDAAARTTALTGVVAEGMLSYLKDTNAVEVYDGSSWVASDDPNAIQNTIVDAKGDLIAASADNVPARLAAGNNGETLVADSSATTGLRYSPAPAIGNPILNSAYQVWQRNTSATYTGATNQYTGADRWSYLGAAGSSATISRQATGDTTNLPNIQYCTRYLRTAANTDTNTLYFAQTFDTINTYQFVGKTITLSFYARKGANYSAASSYLAANLAYGTGTDQALNGGAAANNIVTQQNVLTSTWTRFSVTAAVPTAATQLVSMFTFVPVGTAGAADYYEITGVQIDQGSVALPFRTYAATIQGELAACQRYYQKSYSQGVTVPTNATAAGMVSVASGNLANSDLLCKVTLPVVMRTAPTVTIYSYTTSQTGRISAGNGTDLAASSGNTDWIGDSGFKVLNSSGGTVSQASNGFAFHYAVSAEL
jgi:hypothetical protein